MFKVLRTNSNNKDFQYLIKKLNDELLINNNNINNEIQKKYDKLNIIEDINTIIIIYIEDIPAGCGCFREYNKSSVEIKRMFVIQNERNKGIALSILNELEKWIKELKYNEILLETGKNMIGPRKLYEKNGYKIIDNYGYYIGVNNSICMKKQILKV